MYLNFNDSAERKRSEVREFLKERLPENWTGITAGPEALAFSFDICRELADRGWLTESWPIEYGGSAGTIFEQLALQEELWGHFEPRGGQYMGADRIGPTLMKFGTDRQRRELLPPIARGEVQWAQLFSEPEAGSDLAALSTRAEFDGERFLVNGEKIWTSYANAAKYGLMVARSLPGSTRKEGLSVLIIDMQAPGVQVNDIPTPLGWHRIHSVVFTDVEVPAWHLVGELHDGWRVATETLSLERLGIPRYARSTRVLGLIENILVHREDRDRFLPKVAACLAFGRAVETATYRAVWELSETDDVSRWKASTLRVLNGLYEQEVAELAEDVLGPLARLRGGDDHSVERGQIESFVVRQAPTGTVTGGAYEIQMTIVARDALKL